MILNLLVSTSVLIFLIIYGNKFSKRGKADLVAIQSAHEKTTVRFGGVAIICSITTICLLNLFFDISMLILISGLPIFIGGLIEDITGRVRPRNRLLAAFFSAGIAAYLTGAHIGAGDFWLLDKIFIFPLIAIPITMLISSGIANSFNIIDGINGFSAGIALIISCVLGHICQLYGESNLSYFCYIIAIALVPFLMVNFPFGYIFLGDAGAYTLGHSLSWIAIVLMYKHPEISAWALLLIFFWPATETILSIYRRFMSNTPSAAPDSFHFHQLIMQLLQLRFGKSEKMIGWANPLSTLILMPLAGVSIFGGLFLVQNNLIAILVYLGMVFTYLFLYVILVNRVKFIALHDGRNDVVERLNHIFRPKEK